MPLANELLVEFVEWKNDVLNERAEVKGVAIPDYAGDKDIAEIREWDESTCKRVIHAMGVSYDGQCCPWCIANCEFDTSMPIDKLQPRCENCEYGSRHGICDEVYDDDDEPLNNYGIITAAFVQQIKNIIGLELVEEKLSHMKQQLEDSENATLQHESTDDKDD